MDKNFYLLLAGLACLLHLCHCQRKPDFEAEKTQLLQLHAAQQQAHLNKNADQFVAQFADNLLMVNRGKISADGLDKIKNRVQGYFDAVEFQHWEDIAPPRIFFSDDATLAYVVVDKSVVLTRQNEQQQAVEENTHFAWVSIYQKQAGGDWKMVCNISTNETPVEQVLTARDTIR